MRIRTIVVVAAAAGALVACQTPRRPVEAVAKADAAVEQADLGSAAEHAPLELRLAREKLEKAKASLRAERYTDARRFAEQALVDVQLAEVKAESETARTTAQDLRQGIETIEDEARRGSSPEPLR
jgi:hypothetical protein